MDPVGPKKSSSMSMDVDDDAPSDVSVPSNLRLPDHPTGSHVVPFPLSSSANVLRGTGDAHGIHGLTRQRRDIFFSQPSILEPTSHKRKRTDDAPHPDIMEHGNAFGDSSNPPPSRRVRPRLGGREDREFPPLLIMSPGREPSIEEEMVLVSHYPPNPTDSSHSIQRFFRPSISSSFKVDDLDDHMERRRSGSANSLAEVALASVDAPKRLSTLEDFSLPRPFEEVKQSSSGSLVHERGLDAGPLFLSARPGRTGSSEPGGSSRSAMPSLELCSTRYFDEPLCESPDSIDPADGGLVYPEIRMTQNEHDRRESVCSSHDGQ